MSHYETPDYELIQKEEPFELRKYPSFYLVEYDNDADPEIDDGFNTLFSYIGNNNEDHRKIKMTIPVIEEMEQNKKKMAFVVPKELGEKIPKPKDSHLSVIEFEAGFYAVIIYSGKSTTLIEHEQADKLHRWIEKNEWLVQSNDKLALYNAPFIPGIFRRNEIMVKIQKTL